MKFDVSVNKREFKAYVESESMPGCYYLVQSDDDGALTCSCKGWQNRFSCKHVKAAFKDFDL